MTTRAPALLKIERCNGVFTKKIKKIGSSSCLRTSHSSSVAAHQPFILFPHATTPCSELFHSGIDLSEELFLDALASLGSMLESESVSQSMIHVFEVLSNLGHIFRLSSGYVQSMFRVCSEYVQSMFRVCSEYVQY